jgi:hypothetical protein
MSEDEPTGMYELLDALEAVVRASDPAKLEALATTVDAFCEDFPNDFFWASGPQAPTLLHHLMMSIDGACRPGEETRPRSIIRLVDRKH